MNTTLTPADLDPRRQAMLLYFQGYRVARIAEMLGEKVATVHSWKKRDKWGDYGPLDQMQLTTAARYCQLIMKEHKEGKDFKEIDLLARQSERHARIGKFNNGGNEADLNPNVANRNKGPRRQPEKNVFTDEQIQKLEEIFHSSMFNYQRHWWEAGKTNRIRNLLKSRQIGATFYFAREALIDALLTGRNQIFLSASKAQAHVFKQYIIDFAKEVEVELKGDPMVLPNGATLYFLGTNARMAQNYHGNLYLDEYFWIPKFQDRAKWLPVWLFTRRWRQTYFSTPSSLTHSAYPFWSGALFNRGRNKADKVDIDLSHSNLAPGLLCADGQYRQIVTVEDAVRGGVPVRPRPVAHGVQPGRIPDLLCASSLTISHLCSRSANCRRAWWTAGKSGPTFMNWRCARLAGAKCGSVMTRQKVRRTATAPDAWWWHRQPRQAGSFGILSVTSGAGWTSAPRLTPSKN
ncbi:terminase large subunit domain-containing protein (plasmid) [Salmonella enterica subsp. enterica serovar Agona]